MNRRKQLLMSLTGDREHHADPELGNRSLDRLSSRAEIWGAVVVGAAAVGSAAMNARSAGKAAGAAQRGADAATAESARQFDITDARLAPWRDTGAGALNMLADLYGIDTPAVEGTGGTFDGATYLRENPDLASSRRWTANPEAHYLQHGRSEGRAGSYIGGVPARAAVDRNGPNMSSFFTSPDYTFRRDEGTRGIENTFAGRGGAQSGNALRALSEFNSNLAAGEFGSYVNRLAGIAGVGQSATNQTAAYGAQHANNAGQNAIYAGDARASGIIGQSNAIGQGVNSLAGLYGYYQNNRVPGGYGGTGYGGGAVPSSGVRYA